MASRLALLAFLALLLLSGAGAHRLGSGAGVSSARAEAAVPLAGASSEQRRGTPEQQSAHILWNTALWLLGLGLVATFGRRGELRPALD